MKQLCRRRGIEFSFAGLCKKKYRASPLFFFVYFCLAALPVQAANPDGSLRIEIRTGWNLVVDSNAGTPSSYAPKAAYISALFCNDGTNTLTDVYANVGDYAAQTPGIYPSRTHMTLVGPLPGGEFALQHEGGSLGTLDATRYIGTLEPGECKAVYWLISYDQLDENGVPLWGPSVKPDDDLWLEYDVWGTANELGSPLEADDTRTFTFRNEISASANKIFPNGANKVPDEYKELLGYYYPSWTNMPVDGSPGSVIITEGIWYDLGNIGDGFDNNGDLIPDKNAWMQPVGDASLFDPSCFRLTKTYAFVIVKLKTGGEEVYVVDDQLYFENIPENNGAVGFVGYVFTTLRSGCYGQLTPYQEVASGFDNEKFNADYGASLGEGLVSGTSKVEMAKSVDLSSIFPGTTLVYNVTFTNAGTVAVGLPQEGVPLVVQDSIPSGTFYVAGSATNNYTLPPGVASYVVLYSTNNGAAWVNTEPAAATNVTDIQWRLSDPLEGGGAGSVSFSVLVPVNYSNAAPQVVNTAGLSIGGGVPFMEDDAITFIKGSNTVGDTVWVDDGSGGGYFGNGIKDGTEQGLANVLVSLYFDADGDGIIDAGDFLIATTNTGAGGTYLFSQLYDGYYIVRVDHTDPDIPLAYGPTTPLSYGVSLDAMRTNASPVSYLDADFGFVPVLAVTKTQITTNTLREGGTVSYALTVTNRLLGNGTGAGSACESVIYAAGADLAAKPWVNEPAAYTPPYPDGVYATNDLEAASEQMHLTDFRLSPQAGSPTNVKITLRMHTVGTFSGGDYVQVEFVDRVAGSLFTTNVDAAAMNSQLVNGDLLIDVTTAKAWTWADFNGTNSIIRLTAQKGGGPDGGSALLDAAGFLIQSDSTCGDALDVNTLTPVPLTDTYDASRLRFISATLDPDSMSTNRSAPDQSGWLYWNDIGPIYPGGSKSVTVQFELLEGVNNGAYRMTNRTYVTDAMFLSGSPANSATAQVGSIVYPSGTIGDFVWRDINGDGVQDSGEPGIPNVSVILFPPAGVDVGGGAGLPVTNTTDSSGYYLFTGIPADGTYTVTVLTATLPGGTGNNTFDADGNHDSSTAVYIDYDSATGGDTSLTNDFGYILATTIEGTIWHDVNRSGTGARDLGEEWLTNVTVYLCPGTSPCGAGSAIATQQTSTAGYFLFVGNYTGQYNVSVNTNTGMMGGSNWTPSFDTDTTTGSLNYVTVNVVSGGQARADFSYYKTGNYSIGDTLFYDWDGDGIQDVSDEGIADITVWLYRDSNTNGIVDYGTDVLVLSTVTSSSGTYLFANLPATNYLVIVNHADPDFPDLYTTTADPQGALDGRSVVTITTSNRLDQDFGYQPRGTGIIGDTVWFDANADEVQSGGNEYGITNITVTLLADLNGDGIFVAVTSTVTDATGYYEFSDLPPGDYKVQVDAADAGFPDDAFGNPPFVTTATNFNVTVTNGGSYLTADFGVAHLGAIGDTIFWDGNQNGTQDYNEEGITNVTVQLYLDVNSNGTYDAGTDVFSGSTSTDSNGLYLFTGLAASRYVVVVVETGVLATATLMADPNNDGLPCSDPESIGCDGEYGQYIGPGQNFMGADFGYAPPGVLGDAVWIDTDNDGVFDPTEQGISYVDVVLFSGGVPIATNETDGDGYYLFANLPDGEYWVMVDTNDVDFPSGLGVVYDPAGPFDSLATNILISGGAVTNIGSTGCTGCSLDVDFGYRYTGTNTLSGTIGLDGATPDGVMGSGPSGVNADEAPYANVPVYIYLWNDDGDRIPQAMEITLVNQTVTTNNGDYSFADLPAGDGDDEYLITVAAPADNLLLTTTNGAGTSTNVTQTTDVQGNNVSTRQSVPVAPVTINVDFAYKSAFNYDFGDLPDTYSTRLESTPSGARHIVNSQTNLYLGSTIDTEVNGNPSVDATGDGADEDGVIPLGVWQEGTNGGAVQITVGAGTGWLVGYVDFNHDGAFLDGGEMVINQSVSAAGGGVYTNWFTIPTNSISITNSTPYYSRFRLFPSQPAYPALAYYGEASNGEVEDYFWLFGTLGDLVWEDKNADGVQDPGEPGIGGVRVFIDVNDDGSWQDGEPFNFTDTNGIYGIGGFSTGTYSVVVDTNSFPYPLFPVYDLDGTDTVNSIEITVTNGLVRTDLDYGYWRGASVGDYVWDDLNSDGIQDPGEPAMSNITVRLYDSQTNLLLSTATDSAGIYSFTNLVPATYLVQFVAPPFVQFTSADQGGDDELDSDANAATGFTAPVTLTSGETNSTIDAGFLLSAAGIIDLGVVKSVDDLIPNEGDSVVFTIIVSNAGPDNASGVIFTDAVPSGIVFTNTSSGDYSISSNLWTIGDLDAGNVTTLLVYAYVEAGTSGSTLTNTVQLISADQSDVNPANNQDSAVVVVDGTDVGVVKTANIGTVNEGGTVIFTLTATNTTKNPASGVVFADILPPELSFAASSSGDYDDGSGDWTVGALAAHATTSITISAVADMDTGGSWITNAVTLTDIDQIDIVASNNSASAAVYVPLTDVGVTKTASTSTLYEADAFYYTLTVSNAGPDHATSVVVTDALPAGVTFVSSSSADYSSGGSIWTVGSLAAGSVTSLVLNVTVDGSTAGTSITNWLAVSALDQDDQNPANDTDSAVVSVYPFSSIGNFVWIDSNTNNVQDAGEGGWTNLTVNLYDGNSNLLDSTATDSSGIYSFTNLREGWYVVEFIKPTYDFVFVVPDQGGNDALDSDVAKNTGRTPVFYLVAGTNDYKWDAGLMEAEPGLSIVKSADAPGCVMPGDVISYTVEIVNTGTVTHSFTLVTDELQPGITYVTNSSFITAPEDLTNTVADSFSNIAYNNQDGTASWLEDWSSDWVDSGGDGPYVGAVKIADDGTNSVLFVSDRNYTVQRSVDLKTLGNNLASLSFDYRRALDQGQELIYLEVSTNGSVWALMDTFNGVDAAYLRTNYNISSFIGTNTSIRFRTADVSQMGSDDILHVDNLVIEFQRRAITTNAGSGPPTLVSGYVLYTGETLSVTYDVTVATPSMITQVVNQATVNSLTQPPISSTFTVCVEHVDLALEKFVSDDTPSTNQVIAWTLVITNIGPVETDGVEVTDVLPAKTAYISYGASQGVYSNSAHIWYVGYMDVGDVQTLTITAQVQAVSADMITNRADITRSDVFDIEPTNDWDEVVIYPTLVSITSFRLLRGDDGIVVEWVTGSEDSTAGFYLERMDESGLFVRVNREMLPALFGSPQGGTYQYPDRAGAASAYQIIEVEYNGNKRMYGPFSSDVEPAGIRRTSEFRATAHSKPVRMKTAPEVKTAGTGPFSRLKIPVRAAGVCFVSAADIAALMGRSEAEIAVMLKRVQLKLSCDGEPVAYRAADSGMYFFAEARETIYSDENVYILEPGTGLRIASVVTKPVPVVPGLTFNDVRVYEQSVYAETALFHDPEEDFWLWDGLVAGHATMGRKTFLFDVADPASSGAAVLSVRLKGLTDTPATADHHARISVNGTLVAEGQWNGQDDFVLNAVLDAAELLPQANALQIEAVKDAGVTHSTFYLDGFDLEYSRRYRAVNNQLVLRADANLVVTVEGFTTNRIEVWDVTNPLRPFRFSGLTPAASGGEWSIPFRPASPDRVYAVHSPARIVSPVGMPSSGLRDAAVRGAYLVITTPEMAETAGLLVLYRQTQGLPGRVVTTDDIYNEFSEGIQTPHAMNDFLKYAADNWAEPPRFVLLAGAGSYDYRNFKGYGECRVPPLMVSTPRGLYASDNRLADLDGDKVPDIPIGRLPAETPEELKRMISRIVSYEKGGDWKNGILMAADNADAGGKFPADSDALALIVPSAFRTEKIYLGVLDIAGARNQLVSELNAGQGVLHYIGHASLTQLAAEGLLRATEQAKLTNDTRAAFAMIMSCTAGRYDIPGYDCLTETLLKASAGGASAAWAPAVLAHNDQNVILSRAMLDGLFDKGDERIGDAVVRALGAYRSSLRMDYILDTFTLLGDPAMAFAGRSAKASFAEWTWWHFGVDDVHNALLSGALADPDGDGNANLIEFALNIDPKMMDDAVAVWIPGATGLEGRHPIFSYDRRKAPAGVRYRLEVAADLAAFQWMSGPETIQELAVESIGDTMERVTVWVNESAISGNVAFVRLKVLMD